MSIKKRHYNKNWEELPEFKGWLEQSSISENKAICTVCGVELRIHMNDLRKHASSSKHLQKLQEHDIDHFYIEDEDEANLRNGPDYINNPPVEVNIKERKTPPITPNITPRAYNKKTNSVGRKAQKIVLKIRIANAPDPDFIEVDLPKNKLNYNDLILAMCQELDVQPKKVERLRKLPNTKIRRDVEIQRLKDYEELELVLYKLIQCQPIQLE